MMQRFIEKVAIVTGAASGIGRATAERLSSEGASVMLADIDKTGLEETEAGLCSEGRIAKSIVYDAKSPQACKDVVAATIEEFDSLDMLCNVAGVAWGDHFVSISPERWESMLAINLSSVFFTSQEAIPHLLETQGNIVNVASSAGLMGQAYHSVYCASKGGVVQLTKALAVEFAKQNVRVNAVCPGAVQTPIVGKYTFPDNPDDALMARLAPLLEPAEAKEIAGAIAYLGSDEARFVTGSIFSIDGGQTAS